MVTKVQKTSSSSTSGGKSGGLHGLPLAGSVKDSAQQIWQAGLGAFTKAQAEGTKAFEALVKEGVSMQKKTQAAAEEKISEATSRVTAIAGDLSSKATGQWGKLEDIFEERVAKALNKLGVPSAKDVNALIARIDALNASVLALSTKAATGKAASAPKTAPAKRVTAKKAVKAKSGKSST